MNNILERALGMIYQDKKNGFKTSLKRNKFVSIHMTNRQYLATEVFKE